MNYYYVVTATEIYAQCITEQEAKEHIAKLEESDKRTKEMYMRKYGHIPSDVDIPSGYYVTRNPYF